MSLTGSILQIYPFDFKPSAPPVGSFLMYMKTDNTLYLQDSTGIEYAFGSTGAITQLTGEATATGPGSVTITLSNSAVIGKVLTGFVAGPNSPVVATDSILQAFEKLQAQSTATSGSAITTLTGDVSAAGPGSVSATVNSVGGKSAAAIATSVSDTQAATASNTASTLVKRDASGNFAANIITATLNGTATNFSGSLVGDVTGTQGATVVSTVGGSTAANVHTAELAANAATSSNTPNTIVKRDVSGNFSAGTITANLTGNASGSAASFTGSLVGDVTGTQGATVLSATTNSTLTSLPALTSAATLSTVDTITTGTWNATTIAVNHGGTGATTAPAARVNLNIDERSTFSNAPYTVLSTDRYVAQIGTMTASRIVTLPAANSVNAGQQLTIADESGTVSTTNILTITAAGADTINGSATKTIRTGFGYIILYSNGTNEWFAGVEAIGRGGTGLSTLPTDGQILIGQTSTSSYVLSTLTASTGISITNAGGSITIASSGQSAQVTKTANYTITANDSTIFCDTTGGAFTLTLPDPSTIAGKIYRIIDTGGVFQSNNLTLARHASEKIEGLAASKVLQTNWGWFQVTTNGTDWFVG